MDRQHLEEWVKMAEHAKLDEYERAIQKDELWIDSLVRQTSAAERQAAAMEQVANFTASLSVMVANMNRIAATVDRIDASLEKLAGKDGLAAFDEDADKWTWRAT